MTDPVISDLHRHLRGQEKAEALEEEAALLREDPHYAHLTDEDLHNIILDDEREPDDYYPEDFYTDPDDRG